MKVYKKFLSLIISLALAAAGMPAEPWGRGAFLAPPQLKNLSLDDIQYTEKGPAPNTADEQDIPGELLHGRDAVQKYMKVQLRSRENMALRDERSQSIRDRLKSLTDFTRAKVVGLYYPLSWEVDIQDIIREMLKRTDKTVALPVCNINTRTITYYKIKSFDDLVPGAYGIMEPDPAKAEPIESGELNVLLFSVVAFDPQGMRLGYGYGYSESFVKTMDERTSRIGVAFSFQMVDEFPVEADDVRLDHIITEDRIISLIRTKPGNEYSPYPVKNTGQAL